MSYSTYVQDRRAGLGFSPFALRDQIKKMERIKEIKEEMATTQVEPEPEPEAKSNKLVIGISRNKAILYGGGLAIGALILYRRRK